MLYIDTKEKLATLVEKLLNGTAAEVDKIDAKDLVSELRSSRSEIIFRAFRSED